MLSRHFLRCKVLQTLYSGRYENLDALTLAHNFDYHVGHLNQLGILQLALLPAIVLSAREVLEDGKKKYHRTHEDENPNMRMVENSFIRRMTDNYEFKKHLAEWGGCWDTHSDLVRETFLDLRTRDFYRDYLANPEEGFAVDKDFAINLFRYLMNREALVTVLAERSLLWEDDFEQIAQYNFMMLKGLEEQAMDEAMQWPLMYDRRREKDEEDMSFARQLLRAALSCKEEAEGLIRQHLQGWEFERVSPMDVQLIIMAVAELVSCPSIPEKVTVDEYIELSKEFSSERSRLFINGILDKLILDLRSQGRIQKSGRGLAEL